MGSIYFQALPQLGFNQHITKEFRTLPSEYQGIGLRQWSIEKLGRDLAMLLRHWGSDSTLARSFQALYEAFQMEVGVNGNVLSRSYSELSHLATHSWFKILWQYSSSYDVKILFHDRFHIQPTRERDISIIDWFIQHGFSGDSLGTLNRVQKYYKVHSLADILCADGRT
eukprot:scaffold116441_cov45-Cyclotella_meneghiniana.AAC.1